MIPGPVVAGEHQGPLDGAGGEHDLLRPDAPDPLPRLVGQGTGRWSATRSASVSSW